VRKICELLLLVVCGVVVASAPGLAIERSAISQARDAVVGRVEPVREHSLPIRPSSAAYSPVADSICESGIEGEAEVFNFHLSTALAEAARENRVFTIHRSHEPREGKARFLSDGT
jgi:hypothetical protein